MAAQKEVIIYTDGACINNPGPGGYGVILCYGNHEKQLLGGFRLTTNNRMEIMAAIVGLSALKEPCSVTLYSDSKYLVESMMEGWVHQWKANGWLRNKKERAANTDLWESLLNLCDQHTVTFVWIEGHAGHQWNEQCDSLSRKAADQQNLPIDEGYEREENQMELPIVKSETTLPRKVELGGKCYVWDGKIWHDAETFMKPSKAIIHELNAALAADLEREDDSVFNAYQLLKLAQDARDSLQYTRAQKLARRVLSILPGHAGALAVLSSCLRANGHAQQALDETEAFAGENYAPLLNSRAAALCDLGRWEEAQKVVGRALAIGTDKDVSFAIVRRIKFARPDLYK